MVKKVHVEPALAGGLDHEIWCPACKMPHGFRAQGQEPCWTYNGDPACPNVEPSVRVRMGDKVCHFFIRQGRIEFCDDCTHDKAGQVMELPGLDDDGEPIGL